MTYEETLDYLFSQLPIFQRVGKAAYKADLSNTHALCALLDNPENSFPAVHIAGTNGKGSVSHMIASVLQEAGYKTGLYTSPHLKDFRERIRINGEMIPEADVIAFVERYREGFEPIKASFFEITVGMAFHHFREEFVDIAVIETGLGGRLDSTNVVNPEVSVITSIGLDHTNLLGDTIAQIASEKAGIIKKGAPAVIGDLPAEAVKVMEAKAEEMQSPLFKTAHLRLPGLTTDLKGAWQLKNLRTALAALQQLHDNGWPFNDFHLVHGLAKIKENTGLRGRWETLRKSPLVIADIGHNEEAINAITAEFDLIDYNRLHIVLGTVNDKEVDRMLSILPNDATYYFCAANIPRSLDAKTLQEKAAALGKDGLVYGSVTDAVEAAKEAADANDVVFIGGSAFVVAEV